MVVVMFVNRACEVGNRKIVKLLLDNGADGRCHPVTKYSPLYIACYQGHREVVEMLLIKFPELVQVFYSLVVVTIVVKIGNFSNIL